MLAMLALCCAAETPCVLSFSMNMLRMTMRVPSGTELLTRARICALVSPLTPALITRVDEPFACSMAWSCAGNDSDAGRPYPAVALAPSATICAEQQCIVAK